jgi:hypothetical protein
MHLGGDIRRDGKDNSESFIECPVSETFGEDLWRDGEDFSLEGLGSRGEHVLQGLAIRGEHVASNMSTVFSRVSEVKEGVDEPLEVLGVLDSVLATSPLGFTRPTGCSSHSGGETRTVCDFSAV